VFSVYEFLLKLMDTEEQPSLLVDPQAVAEARH
jgi:hypothetical protein